MKKIAQLTGIFLTAAILVFGMIACDTGTSNKKTTGNGGNDEALLTKLILAEAEATLGQAISESEWNGQTTTSFSADKTGDVIVMDAQFLTDADIAVTVSTGATAQYYVQTSGTAKPQANAWAAIPATLTLSDGNNLYIQVTSEDGETVNYYKIQVAAANNMVTLGEVKAGSAIATNGTGNTTWASVTQGSLGLSSVAASNATLSIKKGHISQTISFAKVEKATGITNAPTTWTVLTGVDTVTTTVSVADGDFLCIKVVSGDASATNYFIIEAQVGWNADLTGIKFGNTSYSNENLGTPDADVAKAEAGEVLMEAIQPTNGFVVSATVAEEGATYKLAQVTGTGDPDFSSAEAGQATIQFADSDFLYIEVTAGNGTNKKYYKVQVQLVQTSEIKYGIPTITNGTLDELWDDDSDLEVYKIEKVYPADSTAAFRANPDTKGEAKALWNDKGLFVYWKVWDKTASTGGNQHTADSIELFINEAYQPGDTTNKYNQGGSQYRVGRDGATSGDPGNAVTLFNTDGQKEVWTWGTAGEEESGYIVTMFVPWRFTTFMHENGQVPDNKMFGMELQINACTNGRDGVVIWNNVATSNYQNTRNFGVMTLLPPDGPRVNMAETPDIDETASALASANYALNATAAALTVEASVEREGATLTYQWKSAANATDEGTDISGATTKTYTPVTTTAGRTFYWCVVKHNDPSATEGYKDAEAISPKVRITVNPATVTDVTYNNSGAGWKNTSPPTGQYETVVRANLPADLDISLYNKFEVTFKLYSDAGFTTQVTTALEAGKGQVNWADPSGTNIGQNGSSIYNFGQSSATSMSGDIPENVINHGTGLGFVDFLTSDTPTHAIQYLHIESIKFSKE